MSTMTVLLLCLGCGSGLRLFQWLRLLAWLLRDPGQRPVVMAPGQAPPRQRRRADQRYAAAPPC